MKGTTVKYEVKIPAVGESVTEATIGSWNKKNGEAVKRNDVLMSIETDKASVEVVAEQDGVLNILVEAGQTVPVGSVVGNIDSEGKASVASATNAASTSGAASKQTPAASPTMNAASAPSAAAPSAAPTSGGKEIHADLKSHLAPSVQKLVTEKNLDASQIQGTGRDGRITKEDALKSGATSSAPTNAAGAGKASTSAAAAGSPMIAKSTSGATTNTETRVPMTTIRKRIAERLVYSQQSTATLTTFNEIDMSRVMDLRAKYKDKFKEKYGVSLGFMGFFVKATIEALKAWPAVNSRIDGNDLIYHNYVNVGVAVGTDKGLIVPVIRNAENLTVAGVEMAIRDFAVKARDGKIGIDDLSGGTFTISNGGVYGSLMSTPILNPPQSGILGMHKIEERPMAINGKVEIRPMMYVALSYDHRVIDGKEAVSFLVKIKEGVEDPERLLIEV